VRQRMSQNVSLKLAAELWIALHIKEAIDRLCDLMEETESELSSRNMEATAKVMEKIIFREERPSLIKKVCEECGYSKRYAAKVVDKIIGSLRAQVINLEGKGMWGRPGSRFAGVKWETVKNMFRGRPPAVYQLKPPDTTFDQPEDLKQMVNLVLLLSGTAQRYLKIMIRISHRKEVLSAVCEITQNQAYELLKQPLAKEAQEEIEKAIQGIEEDKKEIEESDFLDQLTPDQLRKAVDEVVDGWFQPILEPIYQQVAQMLRPSGPVNEESSKSEF